MDIEYADNDIGKLGWLIVLVKDAYLADLSEDETVGVLPSCPDSDVGNIDFVPICQVSDDTCLNMELETMDVVDMVADSDVCGCCALLNLGLCR